MAFDAPINTNEQSFDRVLHAGLPVLTLFAAGAREAGLGDALKQVAKADSGKSLVAKVRAEETPQLVQRYSVRAPTLISFKDETEQSRTEFPSAADVRAHADYVLGRGPKPA